MGDGGDRAEVRLGASGADDVIRTAEDVRAAYERAADGVGNAWQNVGSKITGAVGGAIKSIGGSIGTLATDSIRLATAMGNISLARAVDSARQFDEQLGRITASRGIGLAELNTRLTATSKNILIGEPQIAAEARGIAALTGDFKGAMSAMKGLGEEAIATGRSADEMAPLGVVLKNVLGVSGETEEALGKIRAQADKLGTVGGAAMFERQIEALGGAMAGFDAKTERARDRLTAFAGVLGRGLAPNVASKVQQQTLGALESSALEINRTLGRDILDENGNVQDPARVIRDLSESMKRRGMTGPRALRGWRRYLGNQAGSRVFNALQHGELSEDGIATLAGLRPSEDAHDAAGQFAGSKVGERLSVQLEHERAQRSVAEPLLDAQTSWGKAFSGHPIASAAAGNLSAAAGMSGAKWLSGKFEKWGDIVAGAGRDLAEGGSSARRALAEGATTAAGALSKAAPAVGSTAAAAGAEGISLSAAAAGGVTIAIAGAATIVGAAFAAGSMYSEQSRLRELANEPGFERRKREKAASFMETEEVPGSGVGPWNWGATSYEHEKPEVGRIINATREGRKLGKDELARADRDPALKALLTVAQAGRTPTKKDFDTDTELARAFEKLPIDIANRLIEALAAKPLEVKPPVEKPADKVKNMKGTGWGRMFG